MTRQVMMRESPEHPEEHLTVSQKLGELDDVYWWPYGLVAGLSYNRRPELSPATRTLATARPTLE